MNKERIDKILDVYTKVHIITSQLIGLGCIIFGRMEELYPNGGALSGDWLETSVFVIICYLLLNICFLIPAISIYAMSIIASVGMAVSPIVILFIAIANYMGVHADIPSDLWTWFPFSMIACPIGILNLIVSHRILNSDM